MLRTLLIIAILFATDAAAGQIVWRSPVAGVLPHVSDSSTQPEPEESAASGIHYEPIHVAAGSVVSVLPSGAVTGYSFALRQPLPPGLTLDSNTGKIAGLAAAAGNYSATIRAQKDGAYSDLMLSITIS